MPLKEDILASEMSQEGEMAKKKEVRTNAMRILEREKIPYEVMTYACETFVNAGEIADLLGLPHEKMFKTLVTRGKSGGYFVFVIPIDGELSLKKAARSVGEKSVEMIHVKEIFEITGYIRGGCTAIGMKKQYPVRIDQSAEAEGKIIVSGGKIGAQIELLSADLLRACQGQYADLLEEGAP